MITKTSIIISIIGTLLLALGLWPIGIPLLVWGIYRISREAKAQQYSGEAEELERQREIERKEIDMVRKSNEILLHLIQDEHREEGDR